MSNHNSSAFGVIRPKSGNGTSISKPDAAAVLLTGVYAPLLMILINFLVLI